MLIKNFTNDGEIEDVVSIWFLDSEREKKLYVCITTHVHYQGKEDNQKNHEMEDYWNYNDLKMNQKEIERLRDYLTDKIFHQGKYDFSKFNDDVKIVKKGGAK